MAYGEDVAEATLELTFDRAADPTSLHCAGTLDARSSRHIVEAVEELLAGSAGSVTVDVGDLHVADSDGAHALAQVQLMVRDAGVALDWKGLRWYHLAPPVHGPHAVLPASWLPSPAFPWSPPDGPRAA